MESKRRFLGNNHGLAQNIFSFTFTHEEDKDVIWEKRIWHVNKALLILREWNHNLTSFWIQAHGMHFTGVKPSNVEKLPQIVVELVQKD